MRSWNVRNEKNECLILNHYNKVVQLLTMPDSKSMQKSLSNIEFVTKSMIFKENTYSNIYS